MQLLSGAITLLQLQKVEESVDNPGLVTVPTGGIQCVGLASMNVTIGDRIFLCAHLEPTKGGVAGLTVFNIQKIAGTASVSFVHNRSTVAEGKEIPANRAQAWCYSTIARVGSTGTLTLGVYGWSKESDSTMAANKAQLYAWLYRGGS